MKKFLIGGILITCAATGFAETWTLIQETQKVNNPESGLVKILGEKKSVSPELTVNSGRGNKKIVNGALQQQIVNGKKADATNGRYEEVFKKDAVIILNGSTSCKNGSLVESIVR